MATDTPSGTILLHVARPQLQPIRLPAEGLVHLHRVTDERLRAFVHTHTERFPQRLTHGVTRR